MVVVVVVTTTTMNNDNYDSSNSSNFTSFIMISFQYFDTFSRLSCLRCLEKDQSPPLICHWLLEPLSGCDPADRVHLALDFSYIRAANPPSGSSEKETVDNVTTFLLTVRVAGFR